MLIIKNKLYNVHLIILYVSNLNCKKFAKGGDEKMIDAVGCIVGCIFGKMSSPLWFRVREPDFYRTQVYLGVGDTAFFKKMNIFIE